MVDCTLSGTPECRATEGKRERTWFPTRIYHNEHSQPTKRVYENTVAFYNQAVSVYTELSNLCEDSPHRANPKTKWPCSVHRSNFPQNLQCGQIHGGIPWPRPRQQYPDPIQNQTTLVESIDKVSVIFQFILVSLVLQNQKQKASQRSHISPVRNSTVALRPWFLVTAHKSCQCTKESGKMREAPFRSKASKVSSCSGPSKLNCATCSTSGKRAPKIQRTKPLHLWLVHKPVFITGAWTLPENKRELLNRMEVLARPLNYSSHQKVEEYASLHQSASSQVYRVSQISGLNFTRLRCEPYALNYFDSRYARKVHLIDRFFWSPGLPKVSKDQL